MAIDFSDFTDIGVGEEAQKSLLRPIDSDMAILKHDARDGSLSIFLSNGNNEKPDEIEEIKEISFAPVLIYGLIKGGSDNPEDPRYSSSLSSNLYHDVYKRDNNGTTSLGIIKSNDAYQKSNGAARFQWRIIGVMRSVDNKNPKSIPEIEKHFEDEQIVPCFIDLKTIKTTKLQEIVGRNWRKAIKNKIVTIKGGKKGLNYKNAHGGKSYYPAFEVSDEPEALKKLATISEDYLQACMDFSKEVATHDEFIRELYMHQFTQPKGVENLRDLGISDVDSLNTYFEDNHTDWDGLRKTIGEQAKAKQDAIANAVDKLDQSMADQKQELKDALKNDTFSDNRNDEIDVSDDALPF